MMQSALPALSWGANSGRFKVSESLTGVESIAFAWSVSTASGSVSGQTQQGLTQEIITDEEESITLDYILQLDAGIR